MFVKKRNTKVRFCILVGKQEKDEGLCAQVVIHYEQVKSKQPLRKRNIFPAVDTGFKIGALYSE